MPKNKEQKYYNGEMHIVVRYDPAQGKYLLRPKSGGQEIWVDAKEFVPTSSPGGLDKQKRLPRRRGQPPR